jgi:hypothetical protein
MKQGYDDTPTLFPLKTHYPHTPSLWVVSPKDYQQLEVHIYEQKTTTTTTEWTSACLTASAWDLSKSILSKAVHFRKIVSALSAR